MALAHVLLALALAAPPSPAAPPEELREEVIGYLGAIHRPVSPEAFRALGPGVEDVLADLAVTDPSPLRRVRALEALAGLGGPRAVQVHREVLAGPAPREVRRGAARGLGRLLGPGAPATLGPVLERDRDPAVRAAAAEALARAAPGEGCARVRARAKVDPEAARFRHALEDCDRQAGPPGR
jgi:HEAT repeat protein